MSVSNFVKKVFNVNLIGILLGTLCQEFSTFGDSAALAEGLHEVPNYWVRTNFERAQLYLLYLLRKFFVNA